MQHAKKTKNHLIEELSLLQQQMDDLKKAMTLFGPEADVFEVIGNNMQAGIYIIQDDKTVFTNSYISLYSGYSQEELLNLSLMQGTVHPEDRERVRESGIGMLKGEDVTPYEYRILCKDGRIKWLMEKVASINYQGKRAILGNTMDVTDKKRTEDELRDIKAKLEIRVQERTAELSATNEALKDSEEKYRHLFENAGEGILIVRGEMIEFANPALAKILGWPICSIRTRPFVSFIHPEDREMVLDHHIRRMRGEPIDTGYDSRIISANGQERWLRIISQSIPWEGTPASLSFVMDITDRKQADKALCESETKSRTIFESIEDIYFQTDLNGIITLISPSVYRLSGWKPEELIGQPATLVYAMPEDRATLLKAFSEHEYVRDYELALIMRDGTKAMASLAAHLIYDSSGVPAGLAGSLRDITDRKRVEHGLSRSEEKYRELVENANSIILRMDNVGNVTFINKYAQGFFGYTEDEIFGKNVVGTIVPEIGSTGRELRSLIEDIAKNPDSYVNNINENMRSNGERVWIVWTNKPILDEHGRVKEIMCIGIDTTDRKRVEEALKESENWYRTIFENTGTATVILDEDTTIILANGEYEKLSGYTKNELEGKKSWTDFVVKEDLDRMIASHKQRRIDKDIAPKSYEFRFRDQKGNTKNVFLTIDMIPDTKSSVASLLDVTERKMVEDALYRSEERFRTIFNSTFQFTGLLTPDGMLIEANQTALDFAGITMEDVVNRPFWEARWWWGDEIRVQQLKKAITRASGGESIRYEVELQGANKTTAIIDFLLTPVFCASGEITLLIPEGRDITEHKRSEEERKRLEERLQRAEKMESLGTLAGGVAHDLNNVLGVLVGYSELLAEKLPEDSPLRRYANNILQSGLRGAAIIQDLLTLARRGVTISEVVDLNRIISDYLKTPEFEDLKFRHLQVKIWTELEEGLLNIKGSPVHLGKTIMNLVSNAAESISGRGEVTIRTENRYLDQPIQGYDEMEEGDYVVLTVSDTGSGISADDVGKIFEPFYTKKVMGRSGTGLGLAVVWGTVKDHHGTIDVQSEEGKGSTFTLYFPVTREESVKTEKTLSLSTYTGRGESILVVDDVQEQRELAMSMLERLGYQVEAVSSGEAAIK